MNTQDLVLIERYYRGQLSAAEREAFEQRLESDAAFREEALLHKQAMDAVALHARDVFKKHLDDIPIPPKRRIWWPWPAGILLAGLVFYLWPKPTPAPLPPAPPVPMTPDTTPVKNIPLQTPETPVPQPLQPAKLYARAYKPYRPAEGDGALKGGQPVQAGTLDEIRELLRTAAYDECLIAYEKLPEKTKTSLNALFLKASALMALDRFAEAAPLFEQIAANPQNIYAGEAKWYLALGALKQNKLPETRKWLKLVMDDGGVSRERRAEAQHLWQQLQR